jgi:hypothetical protein
VAIIPLTEHMQDGFTGLLLAVVDVDPIVAVLHDPKYQVVALSLGGFGMKMIRKGLDQYKKLFG